MIEDRDAVYYPWAVVEEIPALVRPAFRIEPGTRGAEPEVHVAGFLIVELNETFLERQYFSDLVDRHFGAPGQRNFAVAIRSAKAPYRTVYASDPGVSISASSPDAAVDLFDLVGEEAKRRGHAPLQSSDAEPAMATGRAASGGIAGRSGGQLEAPQSGHQSGLTCAF